MKNLNSRFDSIKTYVPNLFTSSKEKVTEIFTLMTQSESDFLTKAENTETDIRELLNSKMEMEVILGLKFLMIHILKGKDISKFHPHIVNLYLSNNYLIKKLCLNLIDQIALEKRDVLILLYNSVNKKVSDTDPLQRWSVVHLITALKSQSISLDCSKNLIPLLTDSNPLIRRLGMISLVQYIKNYSNKNVNVCISDEEFTLHLQKYFNDPHPLIFSTAFYAICELKNKDYLSLGIAEKFVYYCENLSKVEDFYYERVVFSLINFAKLFIMNNFDRNYKYLNTLFISLYKCVKSSTNNCKILSSLYGIYEIIQSVDNLKLNSISKEELTLFKNGKQLLKVGIILIKLVLCSKFDHEKFGALDLISKFLIKSIAVSSYFNYIKQNLEKNFNIFFIKINEKEYINVKKLEILILLANESNIKIFLEEFKRNLNYPNLNLKKMIVKSIYHICKLNSNTKITKNSNESSFTSHFSITSLCIEKLIDLLKLKEEGVISQIIICLRKLILEIKDQTKFVLIYNIKNYKKNVTSSIAKANIIWMISQYIEIIPTVSVDFFRRLLLELDNELDDVKFQILGFALRIYFELDSISTQYNKDIREMTTARIKSLITYAIDKLLWDKNYNIREKARIVDFVIKNNLFDKELDFISNYYKALNEEKGKISSESESESEDLIFTFTHKDDKHVCPLSVLSKIENEINAGETFSIFTRKFTYDSIDKSVDENIYKISLDDIINYKKSEAADKKEVKPVLDSEKYLSVAKENNVNSTIQNFSGGVNVEELRQKMKNQLDDFLKDEDEDDEYEVEIKKD